MRKLLFIMCAAVAFTGCGNNGGDGEGSNSVITGYDNAKLNQSIASDQTSANFSFTASEAWSTDVKGVNSTTFESLSEDDVWVTLSPDSGDAGKVDMTITIQPNTSNKSRTANIGIVCDGKTVLTVKIEQRGVGVAPDPTVKRVKSVTFYGLNSGDTKELTCVYSYQYDEKGRISEISYDDYQYDEKGSISAISYDDYLSADYKQHSVCKVEYGEREIIYVITTKGDDQTTKRTKYAATLNDEGRVAGLSASWLDEPSEQDTYDVLTYKDGYLVSTKQDGALDSSLVWQNGNLASSEWWWLSTGVGETYSITDSKYPVSNINLDLNWCIYPGEGLAFVAGGAGGLHPLMMQGYCGKTNANFMTSFKTVMTHSSITHTYEYEFDAAGCPVTIMERTVGSSEPSVYFGKIEIQYLP